MTIYRRHIKKLRSELYSREDLSKRIIHAKAYIDRHYGDGIDLDVLSSEACLSKYHFIRQFRRFYGRTPHQYVIEVRIARAKELIRSGMSVQRACLAVGYDSVTSFSALFKKMTGSPPSSIRRKSNFG